MKMSVVWTPPATRQLGDLHDYISQSSFDAADRQAELVLSAVHTLGDFPEIGRPGRRRGTRELMVPGAPYIVAYRIKLAAVEVLAVIHGARSWPHRFSP